MIQISRIIYLIGKEYNINEDKNVDIEGRLEKILERTKNLRGKFEILQSIQTDSQHLL